ncbi:MAG: hypothetical protein A3A24_00380 [Candidatus Buchananbacteria bacterium RIFCSPLOWO2_01_FULL_46_12]|uniref:Response regulatory domain-containing protein n=2 Tax=Candidatus Buchananiibacteriota TaxID=1817903 RepID=A0A1G1YS48_9BACT|nr:MAG: hypothetical protein A2744_02840 [Candidatus Buchananbacteria bacterium RIFCSPHIGHO2_01_FULL_44_11]OGY55178.1 MAG: hypothetical protein A3A24_00380 [Candidatus Buchananbacteria bacterium RIFCSPLOWO2_01_FULL_46_12]
MPKTKILIIEDDKFLSRLIKDSLDPEKFEVAVALSADEGIDQAIIDRPALIVLDILLPGKDGFTCLREMKKNPKIKNIPVIILSNLGQDEEIKKGRALGAVDYIIKANFSIDRVIKKILRQLK